jgi:hypothetical protein
VAIKNRKLALPGSADELYEINDKETISTDEKIAHTNQFRYSKFDFLDMSYKLSILVFLFPPA